MSSHSIVDDHSAIETRYGLSWEDYEAELELRGEDNRCPKLAYLDGVMELVSPSHTHEKLKSWIGRLVETFASENGIELSSFGEWTQKVKAKHAGAEPDECYIFGASYEAVSRPDLVIEIVWTSGGINKLEIYRRFGIPEVWFWIKGAIQVWVLRDTAYEQVERSQCFPALDLVQLCSFLDRRSMSAAVADFRAALRAAGAE